MFRAQLTSRAASPLAALAAIAGLLCLLPAHAGAHAAFLDSSPQPGSRLAQGPIEITLTFTEPLNGPLSRASLTDSESGAEIGVRVVEDGGDRELVLRPEARLGRAPYRVEWHTVSTVDGHALEGSFGFGVRTAALGSEHSVEQSPLAREGWLRIVARALLYAALAFCAGGLFGAALLSRRSEPAGWLVPAALAPSLGGPDARRELAERAWLRTRDTGWLAAGAAAAVAILEATDASGGLGLQGMGDFLLANGAGLARVWTILLAAIAAASARRAPRLASAWLALAFLSISFSGHANSAQYSGPAVLNDWLHLLAGGVWLGGIAQVALTWLPLLRRGAPGLGREVMASVLPRFGEIALPAFLLVALTGVTGAIFQLGQLDALWSTAYGRVLIVKVVLVGLIALASYAHAFRLRPRLLAANPHPPAAAERRHWRLLSAEPLLGLGVLAAVAALVAFPLPPQQLGEAEEAEAAAPCDPCPLPGARAGELVVGEQAGSRIAAFWLRREGGRVAGTLRLLGEDGEPLDAPVKLAGGELDACGVGCWRLRAPGRKERVTATVEEGGRVYRASVPARWSAGRSAAARRLLRRAQRRMRALRSLRLEEATTSGPGSLVRVRYRFRAPDRMAYRTDGGARAIAIGATSYSAARGGAWRRGRFGADGFRLAAFFRWSAWAKSVRWLGSARVGGRPAIELALYDRATPLWYRLAVDQRSGRVVTERLIAESHFMDRRFFAFDAPIRIEPPR